MNTFFDLIKVLFKKVFDTTICKKYISTRYRSKKLFTCCAQVLNKISKVQIMSSHIPVLINKVIEYLQPKAGEIFIDCTLGAGGHSEEILKRLEGTGKVYGIEVDDRNLEIAKSQLINYSNVHFIRDNFENLENAGQKIAVENGHIDGILFDLGLSSLHVDEAERGFSFSRSGPLDMRFDTRQPVTAAEIVNTYPLEELINIFKIYGEEKFSYRIASKIVEHRKHEKFETTSQLADFIYAIVPKSRYTQRIHPATRVFQALRIAANREIEALAQGLAAAVNVLSPGGRLVVISYHSLEDRLVKNFFKEQKAKNILTILTKKPVTANEEEIQANRRSRSAKLRAARKS